MGEIGELWNVAKDTAQLFANGQSQSMGARAFACPAGVQPAQLDWAQGDQRTIQYTRNWTNSAREWFGMSTGTSLRVGCTWTYGGTSPEHPGLYLHDAYLWAVLDYSSAGTDFDVTGGFGDAVPRGNTAELSGWIRVEMSYVAMHWEEHRFDIRVRGNGYGVITKV